MTETFHQKHQIKSEEPESATPEQVFSLNGSIYCQESSLDGTIYSNRNSSESSFGNATQNEDSTLQLTRKPGNIKVEQDVDLFDSSSNSYLITQANVNETLNHSFDSFNISSNSNRNANIFSQDVEECPNINETHHSKTINLAPYRQSSSQNVNTLKRNTQTLYDGDKTLETEKTVNTSTGNIGDKTVLETNTSIQSQQTSDRLNTLTVTNGEENNNNDDDDVILSDDSDKAHDPNAGKLSWTVPAISTYCVREEEAENSRAYKRHYVTSAQVVSVARVRKKVPMNRGFHYAGSPLFQQIHEQFGEIYPTAQENHALPLQLLHTCLVSKLVKECFFHAKTKKELSMVFLPITKMPNKLSEMIWKIGNELMKSPYGNADKDFFLQKMKLLTHYPQGVRIYLDEVVRNFSVDFHLQLSKIYLKMTERISKDRFTDDPYTRLMYGYLEYCLWKEQKDDWERLKSGNNGANSQGNEAKNCWSNFEDEEEKEEVLETDTSDPVELVYHADRALRHWNNIVENTGTWDLLLPKYMEIFSSYNIDKEVWNLLEVHAGNNSDNYLSYVYLILWNNTTGANEMEDMLHVYEKLASLNPSNDLLQSYMGYLRKSKHFDALLDLMVKRLSYTECSRSFFDWDLLACLLQDNQQLGPLFQGKLRAKRYWFDLHYQNHQLASQEGSKEHEEVEALKMKVAKIADLYNLFAPQKDQEEGTLPNNQIEHTIQLPSFNDEDDDQLSTSALSDTDNEDELDDEELQYDFVLQSDCEENIDVEPNRDNANSDAENYGVDQSIGISNGGDKRTDGIESSGHNSFSQNRNGTSVESNKTMKVVTIPIASIPKPRSQSELDELMKSERQQYMDFAEWLEEERLLHAQRDLPVSVLLNGIEYRCEKIEREEFFTHVFKNDNSLRDQEDGYDENLQLFKDEDFVTIPEPDRESGYHGRKFIEEPLPDWDLKSNRHCSLPQPDLNFSFNGEKSIEGLTLPGRDTKYHDIEPSDRRKAPERINHFKNDANFDETTKRRKFSLTGSINVNEQFHLSFSSDTEESNHEVMFKRESKSDAALPNSLLNLHGEVVGTDSIENLANLGSKTVREESYVKRRRRLVFESDTDESSTRESVVQDSEDECLFSPSTLESGKRHHLHSLFDEDEIITSTQKDEKQPKYDFENHDNKSTFSPILQKYETGNLAPLLPSNHTENRGQISELPTLVQVNKGMYHCEPYHRNDFVKAIKNQQRMKTRHKLIVQTMKPDWKATRRKRTQMAENIIQRYFRNSKNGISERRSGESSNEILPNLSIDLEQSIVSHTSISIDVENIAQNSLESNKCTKPLRGDSKGSTCLKKRYLQVKRRNHTRPITQGSILLRRQLKKRREKLVMRKKKEEEHKTQSIWERTRNSLRNVKNLMEIANEIRSFDRRSTKELTSFLELQHREELIRVRKSFVPKGFSFHDISNL